MICNPYKQDKSSLLGVCKGFWTNGYSVLLFDYRSHTKIPSNSNTPEPYWKCYRSSIGYLEERDAQAALDFLSENNKRKVGIVGPSMGGAISLVLASKSENYDSIAGVATDCAFFDLEKVLENAVDNLFPTKVLFKTNDLIPMHKLIVDLIRFFCEMSFGYDPRKIGPGDKLEKISVPTLIVHSEHDSVVPVKHAELIHEGLVNSKSNMEIIKNVDHIGGYFIDEKSYLKKIIDFMDECFDEIQN